MSKKTVNISQPNKCSALLRRLAPTFPGGDTQDTTTEHAPNVQTPLPTRCTTAHFRSQRARQGVRQQNDLVHPLLFTKSKTLTINTHKTDKKTKQFNHVSYSTTAEAQKSRKNFELKTVWATQQYQHRVMKLFAGRNKSKQSNRDLPSKIKWQTFSNWEVNSGSQTPNNCNNMYI